MKAEEIRNMSIDKIEEQLDETREKLMRMRFQKATGELKDQNLPRRTRTDIARMITILKEKRAQEAPAAKAEKPAEPKAEKRPAKKKTAKAAKKAEGEA